jgi:uncharacterized membrane protein (DUF373 family)
MTFGVSKTPKVLLPFEVSKTSKVFYKSKIALHPLQIVGDFLFVLLIVELMGAIWHYFDKNEKSIKKCYNLIKNINNRIDI